MAEKPITPEFTPLEGPPQERMIHVGQDYFEYIEGNVFTGPVAIQQEGTPRIPLQRPPRPEHFVGRERELAQLLQDLQPGKVVTLCGPGGIGKSALAAEAVWRLAPGDKPPKQFPDGIIWHDFYREPRLEHTLESIARAFGEGPKPTAAEAAKRALAGRRTLLLLDGTEEADNLPKVLEIAGNCGVIVTSRNRHDAVAERQDITSMPTNEAMKLLQAWGQQQSFDETAAQRVCELVGGLPLAVRLAGRYLNMTGESVPEYLVQLVETPLETLELGKRKLESVPLLLHRSLEQVSEPARQALAVVGLLALAPFRSKVVAVALNMRGKTIKRVFHELTGYGLLIRTGDNYTVSHALIHTYVQIYYPPPKYVYERLFTYYQTLIRKQMERGLRGYNRLDREREHLFQLIMERAEHNAWETVRSLVKAINDYLKIRGYWTEWRAILTIGVVAAQQLKDSWHESLFLENIGHTFLYQGQPLQASPFLEQAFNIATQLHDPQRRINCAAAFGELTKHLGQHEHAMKLYKILLNVSQKVGDRRNEGAALGNLGNVYRNTRQTDQAMACYEQALIIAREIGDRQQEGAWLGGVANIYCDKGLIEQALPFAKQALVIAQEIGDRSTEGSVLGNLGNIYVDLEQMDQAFTSYQQALSIVHELGALYQKGRVLCNLGNLYTKLEQMDQAETCYKQALAIARDSNDRRLEGLLLSKLGNLYNDLGENEHACGSYQQAIGIFHEIGDQYREELCLGRLGNVFYSNLGQKKQALTFYRQALSIAQEIGEQHHAATCLGNMGLVYRDLGQEEQAITSFKQAVSIVQEIGDRRQEGVLLGRLGNAYSTLGQQEVAITLYKQALSIAQETGDRSNEGLCLCNLGFLYANLRQLDQARECLRSSLTILEETNSPHVEKVRVWLAVCEPLPKKIQLVLKGIYTRIVSVFRFFEPS